VKGFKENKFILTVLWMGIYLLSLLANSVYFLFLVDQQFELGGRNRGEVNS
jgi:hypothetical protein